MVLTEEKKVKLTKVLSQNGYTDIRFEDDNVVAKDPQGSEAKMTNKEAVMLFAFVKK